MSEAEEKNLSRLTDEIEKRLSKLESSRTQRIFTAICAAALGSIPWIGGFLTAAQSYLGNERQSQTDILTRQWLEEHQKKIESLAEDLTELVVRLSSLGSEIHERIESEAYLSLVRKAFRIWDEADTKEKREYVRRLIANAAASTVCPDDLVRLFLDWLNRYHEAHFLVIREIYKFPGITRYSIWQNVNGQFPREDSSEADLFRLLIMDLSFGHVIRQLREVTSTGQFVAKKRAPRASGGVMKSAFDDEESYELTELGRQFVHYVFTDVVTRLEDGK
jgi:hypothetical protein